MARPPVRAIGSARSASARSLRWAERRLPAAYAGLRLSAMGLGHVKGLLMLSFPVYAVAVSLFLVFGTVTLRVIVRRCYSLHGRLNPVAVVLQGLVFFSWGALTWADLPPGWPATPIAPVQRFTGWSLVIVGLTAMVGLIAWFDLRRAAGWRVAGLVRRGPYAITRNPQLLACIVAAIGYVLLWLSLRAIGWLAALMVVIHMMVLTEEEHLRHVFGSEYQAYCERVPRYIGVLPRRHGTAA